jgi:hypothetical protein
MKINVETQYCSYRDPWMVVFKEPVEVEIEQPTGTEAPLAVEWPSGATRWFKGHHYRKIVDICDAVEDHKRDTAVRNFFRNIKGGTNRNACTFPYLGRYRTEEGGVLYWKYNDRRHPGVTNSEERTEAIGRAHQFAADSILIGGALWMKCGQPRLLRRQRRGDTTTETRVDTGIWTIDHTVRGVDVKYPVLDEVAESFSIQQTDNSEQDQLNGIEVAVLVPESIQFDHFQGTIREAVEALILLASNGRLYQIGDVVWDEIDKLRRYKYKRPVSDIDYDYLADALVKCRDNIEGRHGGKRKALEAILRRWEDRPIHLDLL